MTFGSDDPFEQELRAGRQRAAAENRPYAIRIDCDLEWETGAPLPTVLQWEHEAHVAFYTKGCQHVGLIIFEDCVASTFGPPGEEGHTLEGAGWEAYTALQVINSVWLKKMVGPASGHLHYVLPFHDTTFECIARSFRTSRIFDNLTDTMIQSIEQRD